MLQIKYDVRYSARWKHSNSLTVLANLHTVCYADSADEMRHKAIEEAKKHFADKFSYTGEGDVTVDFEYIKVDKDDR